MKLSTLNLPVVYLDMDGVIADLDGGMFDLYGTHSEDMPKSEFFDKYLPDYVRRNMFEDQLVLINAHLLVASLMDLKAQGLINVAICTSTGHFYHPISEVRHQKGKFIEKHFESLIHVPMLTTTSGRDKAVLAHSKAFLIDDHHKNIDRFREAGGGGFLYDAHDDYAVKNCIASVQRFIETS